MPGELPGAVKDRPRTPVAAQQPGERGGVKITLKAVGETVAMAKQPAEQRVAAMLGVTKKTGGLNVTVDAVRETVAIANQPAEQQVAAALKGTEQSVPLDEISGIVFKAPSRNSEHFRQTGRSVKTADSDCRVC